MFRLCHTQRSSNTDIPIKSWLKILRNPIVCSFFPFIPIPICFEPWAPMPPNCLFGNLPAQTPVSEAAGPHSPLVLRWGNRFYNV